MQQRSASFQKIIDESTGKLSSCYQELRAVMPEYFFKVFSENEICSMLPFLTLLQPGGAPLQTEIGKKVFRFYLRDESCKVCHTSGGDPVADLPFTDAVIHESSRPFTPAGSSQLLVVESFLTSALPQEEPAFTFEELENYFKANGGVPEGAKELYGRLNWSQLSDLTVDRMAERLTMTLQIQGLSQACVKVVPMEKGAFKMLVAAPNNKAGSRYFGRIIEALQLNSFHLERAYWREFSHANSQEDLEHAAVDFGSFYFDGDAASLPEFERAVKALYWTDTCDLFHRELSVRRHWNVADVNLFRAGAEFLHSQFAFVDRGRYDYALIEKLMVLYPDLALQLLDLFKSRFDPDWAGATFDVEKIKQEIQGINSGVPGRDQLARTIFDALLDFIVNLEKTNFFVEEKGALAFRLNARFMEFYSKLTPAYLKSFPSDLPFAVFFFYRRSAAGFQVRFSEIARGGWRTVIPRVGSHELERRDYFEAARDEFFREVYVLAHTQHSKNKDIYEGGSKMITLLQSSGSPDFKGELWEAQKAIFTAFVSLINYDEKGALKEKKIIDYTGTREIVEIGPDENMFDTMIVYMGNYGKRCGYTLGSGIISGKPGSGINHKEYGVTSFGVHEYFLRTLQELGINPKKDLFSVKISGGPFGDVAGNFFKILLRKNADGSYVYPQLRITAITDGPAAICDPAGIDREELAKLVLKANLDKFDPKKLSGDGAYMVFSAPKSEGEEEYYRMAQVEDGKVCEKKLSRDEFMGIFQGNLYRYADILVPCGGRPSTININNYTHYTNADGNGCRAVVEGANSFLTPDARIALQKEGILDVRDASANKCGVITSSYEIMSGLMLEEDEFIAAKAELVPQVMEKLAFNARREAEWLFATRKLTGEFLTVLTDRLSRNINDKNVQVGEYLESHPEVITDELLLSHLPGIFSTQYRDRLKRLPAEYRKAIASVELATRIVYNSANNLANEIAGALKSC